MKRVIRIAILDDHQSIIDGYVYRLSKDQNIKIIATGRFGEELIPIVENNTLDVLLLDLSLPVSESNRSIYPIINTIPKIIQKYPDLKILIITMFSNRTIIENVLKYGASGYIIKDDHQSIRNLANIVNILADGGVYVSKSLYANQYNDKDHALLTKRQYEVLSLCAAYPSTPIRILAKQINIADSTFRNILSGIYQRLGVNSRSAAVLKAEKMGILAVLPDQVSPFNQ
jgi:DNA-binding NarL/FixJ family response regulator